MSTKMLELRNRIVNWLCRDLDNWLHKNNPRLTTKVEPGFVATVLWIEADRQHFERRVQVAEQVSMNFQVAQTALRNNLESLYSAAYPLMRPEQQKFWTERLGRPLPISPNPLPVPNQPGAAK